MKRNPPRPARRWPPTLAALALALALAPPGCGSRRAPRVAGPPAPQPTLPRDTPTVTHRLARGETLWSLSQRYRVSVADIVARNEIRDPHRLPVGLELAIPVPDSEPAAEARAPGPAPASTATPTPTASARPAPPPAPSPPASEPRPAATDRTDPTDRTDRTDPIPAASPPLDLGAVDATLARAESDLHAARFEEALAGASRARGMLDTVAGDPAAQGAIVRTELLTATVLIALGRDEAARESLARALDANPDLTLDPSRTSPKVVEVFEGMRARP